jgi:hypothetical protein
LHAVFRGKGDVAAARAELDAALDFVAPLEEAVRRCDARGYDEKKSFIHLLSFEYALFLLMLRQDWERLAALVALTKLPVVIEEDGKHGMGTDFDHRIRMLIATLDMDRAKFDVACRRFNEEMGPKPVHYLKVYFRYHQLMSAIIDRDTQRVAQFMAEFEVMFARRATDQKLIDDSSFKIGAGKYNPLVFDLWAVTLGLWAIHQGIPVTHSSPVVPIRDFLREAPTAGP